MVDGHLQHAHLGHRQWLWNAANVTVAGNLYSMTWQQCHNCMLFGSCSRSPLYAKLRIRPGGRGKRQKPKPKSKRAVLISTDTGAVATTVSAIFIYLFIYMLHFCDCQKPNARIAPHQKKSTILGRLHNNGIMAWFTAAVKATNVPV